MKHIKEKIMLQVLEAEDHGMMKLAQVAKHAVKEGYLETELDEYTYAELKENVRQALWKTATLVMLYHDVDSLDIQKFDENINCIAEKYVQDIEKALGKKNSDIGPLEPDVPGQTK